MVSKFKITKPLLKKITTWAGNGLTRTDISHLLGYSKNHWLEMMRNNDVLESAYMVGKSDMKSLLQNRVMDLALTSKSDLVSLQSSSYLLNRHHPVADTSTTEAVTTVDDTDIKQEILNDLR